VKGVHGAGGDSRADSRRTEQGRADTARCVLEELVMEGSGTGGQPRGRRKRGWQRGIAVTQGTDLQVARKEATRCSCGSRGSRASWG
jgi:hypothetical protein